MIKLPHIFLDSCNAQETKRAKGLIGKIDGQTTNPTLLTKNPDIKKFLDSGKKIELKDLLKLYRAEIEEIAKEVAGSISIEVNGTWDTPAKEMVTQALEMTTWCHQATIKFPTIPSGLEAVQQFVKETNGERKVNMTLVFDQIQAAAVYTATAEIKETAYISPFAGRWDDRGVNGIDLVRNIIRQYRTYDKHKKSHVHVLAASMRTLEHLYSAMILGADAVTIPLKLIESWVEDEKFIPDNSYRSPVVHLANIVYDEIELKKNIADYKIEKVEGSLLAEGIEKFTADWQSIVK